MDTPQNRPGGARPQTFVRLLVADCSEFIGVEVQTIDGVMYGSDKAGQIARRGYRPGTTGFEGH